MLSEKTPDGVRLTYIGGHVSAGYRIGDEKAKLAAESFNKRFEEGEPVFIQGVEFQKTPDGIRVTDRNNVMVVIRTHRMIWRRLMSFMPYFLYLWFTSFNQEPVTLI